MIFRSDNRSPEQMRPVNIMPDFISTAEGSCLIELGNTRVICTATIEDTVPQCSAQQRQGLGHQRVRHAAALHADPHAARSRPRGAPADAPTKSSGSSAARCALSTDLEKLGERTIFLDCDVIQADGGTRTASITGAFVAMGLAMRRMVESGTLTRRAHSRLRRRHQRRHRRWRDHARPVLRGRLARRRRHESASSPAARRWWKCRPPPSAVPSTMRNWRR